MTNYTIFAKINAKFKERGVFLMIYQNSLDAYYDVRQTCTFRDNITGEEDTITYAVNPLHSLPFLVEGDVLKFMTVNGIFWGLRK